MSGDWRTHTALTGLLVLMAVAMSACTSTQPTSMHAAMVRDHDAATGSDGVLLESAFASNDTDVAVAIALARHLDARNDRVSARRVLDQSLSKVRDVRLLVARAEFSDDPAEQERFARAAVGMDANHPTAAVFLGKALRRQGRSTEATQVLSAHVQRYSTMGWAWAEYAIANAAAGQGDAAIASINIAMVESANSDGDPPAWMWHFLGDVYSQHPKWSGAASRLRAKGSYQGADRDELHYPPLPTMTFAATGMRPPDEAPALGMIFKTGAPSLEVLWVQPISIAARAGVQSGDTLIEIDGHAVPDVAAVGSWSDNKDCVQPTSLVTVRGGARLELQSQTLSGEESNNLWRGELKQANELVAQNKWNEAWEAYVRLAGTAVFFNYEIHSMVTACAVRCGRAEQEVARLDRWLKASTRDPNLQFLRGYAAAHVPKAGYMEIAMEALDAAQREAPELGLYEAYKGLVLVQRPLVFQSAPENQGPNEQIAVQVMNSLMGQSEAASELGNAQFKRALVLGQGSWAIRRLADAIDGRENARRAAVNAERERNSQKFTQALLLGLMGASGGGGGRAFGSNPWKDYGYEAQAIHGPSMPQITGTANTMVNTRWY